MRPVRSKRSHLIHATYNLRLTLCNKRCDSWVIEPTDLENVTCEKCHLILTTN